VIDYNEMADLALELLVGHGRPVVLVQVNTVAADPNKPWRGSETLLDGQINATAVFVDPTSGIDLGIKEMRGSDDSVKRGAEIALVAARENSTEDLRDYDRMIDNGLIYKIDVCHLLSPGAIRLLYTMELSR
jgi:hypothetical protein